MLSSNASWWPIVARSATARIIQRPRIPPRCASRPTFNADPKPVSVTAITAGVRRAALQGGEPLQRRGGGFNLRSGGFNRGGPAKRGGIGGSRPGGRVGRPGRGRRPGVTGPLLKRGEQVPHLLALGAEVLLVACVGLDVGGNSLHYLDSGGLHGIHFFGIV
jgi:hypothetical protein